jgi:hypothetical protein
MKFVLLLVARKSLNLLVMTEMKSFGDLSFVFIGFMKEAFPSEPFYTFVYFLIFICYIYMIFDLALIFDILERIIFLEEVSE